jgi:hypothetical protein
LPPLQYPNQGQCSDLDVKDDAPGGGGGVVATYGAWYSLPEAGECENSWEYAARKARRDGKPKTKQSSSQPATSASLSKETTKAKQSLSPTSESKAAQSTQSMSPVSETNAAQSMQSMSPVSESKAAQSMQSMSPVSETKAKASSSALVKSKVCSWRIVRRVKTVDMEACFFKNKQLPFVEVWKAELKAAKARNKKRGISPRLGPFPETTELFAGAFNEKGGCPPSKFAPTFNATGN